MDRAIFDLSLSVEATSAYILLDSLTDSGRRPAHPEALFASWNADPQALADALTELENHRIISQEAEGIGLCPVQDWRGGPGSEPAGGS